uniref:Tripartite motif-containing protein 32 n=1 Tax=Daphnia magna TaxID=35525 RepID=A0A0P6G8U6_9CRUS
MANQQHLEFEEAITCPVCLSRFDEAEKKPKYLVSCCHTVCRFCLGRISRCGTLKRVACPICRCPTDCTAGIDSLPTNSDKLYLLKLEKPLHKSDDEALNWCFTCRKRTSPNCSTEKHSVIVMNPQLLDSNIQLNMATISARLRACDQAVLQNRIQIGLKLDQISRWLSAHQEMIEQLRTANASRISHLSDIMGVSHITISIQKLMQLSINKEGDLGLLTDSLQEEAVTKKLLEEFEAVEKTAEVSTMGRFNALLELPCVPHLRKELDFTNFFGNDKNISQWPVVLLESLVAKDQNPPIPTKNPFRLGAAEVCPSFDNRQIESRYFTLQQNASATINASSSASTNTRSSTEMVLPNVFRFGNNGSPAASSSSPSHSGTRDFLLAHRRRRFNNSQNH